MQTTLETWSPADPNVSCITPDGQTHTRWATHRYLRDWQGQKDPPSLARIIHCLLLHSHLPLSPSTHLRQQKQNTFEVTRGSFRCKVATLEGLLFLPLNVILGPIFILIVQKATGKPCSCHNLDKTPPAAAIGPFFHALSISFRCTLVQLSCH